MNAPNPCDVPGCHLHRAKAIGRGVALTEAGRALLQKWRDEEAARQLREDEHALRGTR